MTYNLSKLRTDIRTNLSLEKQNDTKDIRVRYYNDNQISHDGVGEQHTGGEISSRDTDKFGDVQVAKEQLKDLNLEEIIKISMLQLK